MNAKIHIMNSKRLLITLFLGFSNLVINAQNLDIYKFDRYLQEGKFKKLEKGLEKYPVPSYALDLVKLSSVQLVYATINNDEAGATKYTEAITTNIDKFDVKDQKNVLEATAFTARNLLEVKRVGFANTVLTKFKSLINVSDESLKLSSFRYIVVLIEAKTLAGFNIEAKQLLDTYGKDIELLKGTKGNKATTEVYNQYLVAKGIYWYQYGNYAEAYNVLHDAQTQIKSNKGTNYNNYYRALYYKALSMEEQGDAYKATRSLRKSLILKKHKSSLIKLAIRARVAEYYANTNKDLNFLRNKAKYEFALRKFDDANPLKYKYKLLEIKRLQFHNSYEKAYDVQKKFTSAEHVNYETLNPWMLELINTQYISNVKTHRYDEASDTLQKYLNLKMALYGEDSPEYAQSRMELAEFLLLYSNELDKAGQILKNDYEGVILKNYTETHKDACDNLIIKSMAFREADAFAKEVEILEQAQKIAEKDSLFEKKIRVYENLSEAYLLNGDYEKAEALVYKSVELIKKHTSNSKLLNSVAYLDLAKFYLSVGKLQEAKKSVNTAKKYAKKSKYDTDLVLGNSLDEQASLLIEFSKFSKAEDLLVDNIAYKTKLFGENSKSLLDSYNSLAKVYLMQGKYAEAESFINKALSVSKTVYGDKSLKYATSLGLQKDLFTSLGDFKKANDNALKIYNIRKEKLGENHIKTADALDNLATSEFLMTNKTEKTLADIDKAMSVYKANKLSKHPYYSDILTNKAYVMLFQKKYDDASVLLNEAVDILKHTVGTRSVKLAETYLVLGSMAKEKGDLPKAEKYINDAKQIYQRNFGEEHPSYVKCLSALGRILYVEGKVDEAIKVLVASTNSYLKFTDTYFKYLNSKEKFRFWASIKEDFEFLNAIVIGNQKTNYYKLVYENTLKTKGLLLSNSQKIVRIINRSQNQALKDKYNEWVLKKEDLRNLITQGGDGDDFKNELLRLEGDILALEKDISKLSAEFKDVISSKETKFSDVQKLVKADECILEMVRYRTFNTKFTDSVVYAALVIDKLSKQPKVVKITDGEKLESRYLSYYRNSLKSKFEDKYSYFKYWKAIDEVVKNYKTIYFSPEGVYHQINVNTIKDPDGKYVIDKYLVVNLTNSKDLHISTFAKGSEDDSKKSALVIASPDFYEGGGSGAVARLDGAEKEGKVIVEILKKDGFDVKFYTGMEAQKDVLKKVNSPTILHIATHGSFQEDEQENSNNMFQSEFLQDPLFKSKLLFARAGDYLENKRAVGVNPLLSAHEVMDLPLEGTKTVVLSACETGLGTNTVGEGVFGMKRAFLVAGAESIFTSLFKVADNVTLELMENYYNYYAAKNYSKERAFYEAQRDIMKKYPEPIYWGSFVLTGNK